MIRAAVRLFRARGVRQEQDEAQGVLCLSVSELGWRATLLDAGAAPGAAPVETREAAGDVASPVQALRRAVRAVSPSQRERIGSVRLLIEDPAACLADNRSTRIRSTDAAAIRQAGAQELGVKDVVYGFQPFGSSSEHEVERGAYAFLSTDRMQDYLGALDSLATKLVEATPAGLLHLSSGGTAPSASLDVRRAASTLLLADPDTGVVVCREIAVGIGSFTAAVAQATSVSAVEAAAGLERRSCFAPDATAAGAASPLTATERALDPILAALRTELLVSVEYFVHQRLAGAPESLAITGLAGQVRGLPEWLAGVFALPLAPCEALHARFVAAGGPQATNLLAAAPDGLLRIGKAEFRFSDGRFRPLSAPQPVRRIPAASSSAATVASAGQRWPVRLGSPGLALTSLALISLTLWATVKEASVERGDALTAMSGRMVVDGVLHEALAAQARPDPEAAQADLYWTDKLRGLTATIPYGLRLTKVLTVPGPAGAGSDWIALEGEASATADSLAGVAGFISRLTLDAGFMRGVQSVTLDGTSAAGPERVSFSVKVALAPRLHGGSGR